MDVLTHIKSLIVRRQYRFSSKALDELDCDELEPEDALEAVLNAAEIHKRMKSRRGPGRRPETLYVIESHSYRGTLVYTKGAIKREAGEEIYYFFVSAKASRYAE